MARDFFCYISETRIVATNIVIKQAIRSLMSMIIQVQVKVNTKQNKVLENEDGSFNIWTEARAVDGKANQAIIKMLSEYYDIAPSSINLTKGLRSINKQFEIY